MKTIKLGKMEPDYGSCDSAPSTPKKKVMRFPTVYVSLEDLPELTVGQEVTLKAVVVAYDEGTRKRRDGKSEKVEESCSAEFEVQSMEVSDGPKKTMAEEKKSDEDAVDEGLSETDKKNEAETEEY